MRKIPKPRALYAAQEADAAYISAQHQHLAQFDLAHGCSVLGQTLANFDERLMVFS